MNLKKFAVRGLVVLAIAVALCMFFSGTIKTITTAKVKLTRGQNGRLEEKVELSGKLTFPEVEPIRVELEEGQTLTITRVNVRPGYTVKAGDVLVEARVADYANAMKQQQDAYDEALDQLLQLESKNANIRVRPNDERYAQCYFALREARKAAVASKVEMDALLNQERLTLPETGVPEGASEALTAAIEKWRAADAAQKQAQAEMDAVERYLPDEATWTYITEKHQYEEKMAEAEQKMRALGELNGRVQAICAPHDGYVAEVVIKEGDTYDGSGNLITITKPDTMPVLRADISQSDRAVTEGMAVTIASDNYGTVETRVTATGVDAEGKKYADVEVTQDVISAGGSVYAMTTADMPMTLIFRAQQSSTLIAASAVHGTGKDRYVYTVDTSYSSFGNSKMTVHKMTVTVLAEADGIASVQEDLGYYDIAYMEDRPINDGDTVMLYLD